MVTLAAQIASAAFTVADQKIYEEYGIELYAFVSGSYITIGGRKLGAWHEPTQDVELYATISTEIEPFDVEQGRDGLYGIEAVRLYEAAIEAINDFAGRRGPFGTDDEGEEE